MVKKLKWNRRLIEVDSNNELLFEPEYSIEKTTIENEENAELHRRVSSALRQLPAKQKEAVYLRYIESLEYPEIAQLLNVSIESVRKQVYRALKSIRKSFSKETFIFWLYFSKNK